MKIVLFDPSLKDNNGNPSDNLGDLIIHEYIDKILGELFPEKLVYRIATHSFPSKAAKKSIHKNDLCFLGGTNILNSTINVYNNWRYDKTILRTIFSRRLNVITLGVGWGEYQNAPGVYSRIFYKKRLHPSKVHSARDSYSTAQLEKTGLKVINTGCPTTWLLNGTAANRKTSGAIRTCVFTLTDYSRDIQKDSKLMETLLENFEELAFFPQGSDDLDYVNSLKTYRSNKNKIIILQRNLQAFKTALKKGEVLYVGTRLHAGILALNLGVESLIISIDNRAREMANDIYLPVIERDQFDLLTKWIKGEKIFKQETIRIPLENIATWKKQFAR
jgi:polysaccharide pyruvyl transferase WcaK-like protein